MWRDSVLATNSQRDVTHGRRRYTDNMGPEARNIIASLTTRISENARTIGIHERLFLNMCTINTILQGLVHTRASAAQARAQRRDLEPYVSHAADGVARGSRHGPCSSSGQDNGHAGFGIR